jgi:hypothetical protein
VAVALLLGSGSLIGCEALPGGEAVHVTATMDVQVLNRNGSPPLPIQLTFTAVKFDGDEHVGIPFVFNAFTDLDGKVSFTVGYNLQKSSQRVAMSVVCADPDGGVASASGSIPYDEAMAQSAGTGLAAITRSVVVQL